MRSWIERGQAAWVAAEVGTVWRESPPLEGAPGALLRANEAAERRCGSQCPGGGASDPNQILGSSTGRPDHQHATPSTCEPTSHSSHLMHYDYLMTGVVSGGRPGGVHTVGPNREASTSARDAVTRLRLTTPVSPKKRITSGSHRVLARVENGKPFGLPKRMFPELATANHTGPSPS